MNEKTWPDTLKFVINMLSSCIPGVWVADHLPGPAELDSNLPAVVVDLLPGDEIVGWGGGSCPAWGSVGTGCGRVCPIQGGCSAVGYPGSATVTWVTELCGFECEGGALPIFFYAAGL